MRVHWALLIGVIFKAKAPVYYGKAAHGWSTDVLEGSCPGIPQEA